MSNRKSSIVVMSLRIKAFALFFALPLRCLSEVTEGFSDLLCLFRHAAKKAFIGLSVTDDAIALLRESGPLDLVDVDVESAEARVKVKLLVR